MKGLQRLESGAVKRIPDEKNRAAAESGETINENLGEAGHGKFKIKITPEEQMIASSYVKGEEEQTEARNMYEKLSREIEKSQKDKLKEGYVSPKTKLEDLFKKN